MTQNDKVKDINLDLVDVEPRTVDYEPVITHFIKNDAPALSANINMSISILDADTLEEIDFAENTNVSIAPNSVMPYSYRLKNNQLEEGDYVSKVIITYLDKSDEEQVVDFEKKFHVSDDQSQEAKDYHSAGKSVPTWAVIIIVGIGMLIICTVILTIVMIKRKKIHV